MAEGEKANQIILFPIFLETGLGRARLRGEF